MIECQLWEWLVIRPGMLHFGAPGAAAVPVVKGPARTRMHSGMMAAERVALALPRGWCERCQLEILISLPVLPDPPVGPCVVKYAGGPIG